MRRAPSPRHHGLSPFVNGQVPPAPSPTPPPPPPPPAPPPPAETIIRWSDPATWGGTLPVAAADVLIPDAGPSVVYLYDVPASPSLGKLSVHGYLRGDKTQNLALTVKGIEVDGGAFEFGTKLDPRPLTVRFDLTLTGARTDAGITSRTNGGFQKPLQNNWVRGIMSMNGGRVEMVRQDRLSRSKLAAHLAAGATSALLLAALSLPAGARMLVAPTTWFGQSSPEVATLAADMNGPVMTLASGLATRRWGLMQYVTRTADSTNANGLVVKNGGFSLTDTGYRPADPLTPYTLDERAEVACLDSTMTISCPNDTDWSTTGFGATGMFMDRTGTVRIDGVRMERCGQQDVQGGYPLHFHNQCYDLATGVFLGDVANDSYIRNCVVENSSNRAIVVHGTCGVTVQNNVCHNIRGQGIFFEDGVERRNFILDNIVSATRRTTNGGVAGNISTLVGGLKAFETRDSTGIWITNLDNTVTGNICFGHDGPGYWHSLPQTAPFGDNVLAFDDDAALRASFVSSTQFSVQGNWAGQVISGAAQNGGSFPVNRRVQLNNGGVRTAGVVLSSIYTVASGVTTVTVSGATVLTTMQAAAIPMNPSFIAPRLSENNVAHSNRSTGNRLDFAVLDERGNVGQNVGAQSQVFGAFGGGNTPTAFGSFVIWKNNGGGYMNRTNLAKYSGWISGDCAGQLFFGSQSQETGGLIQNTLLFAQSLNTDGTMPYVQPQAGVASYHGAIVARNCVFVGFAPIAPDYTIQTNGGLTGGGQTSWDEYTLPVHTYHAIYATGNVHLSSHPGVLMPSPEYDDIGPTLLDINANLHQDFVQATTGQGSPTGFGYISGGLLSQQVGTFVRGWTSAPADKTRMAKWGYGKHSVAMKASEGDSNLKCYKPDFLGADVILGIDTVDYGGQGPTWSQMAYRARIKSDGTVMAGVGAGADTALQTPFQFTSAASNNAAGLFWTAATGVMTVRVSVAGGAFVTKHTFASATTVDLHRYIGVDYTGVAGRDIVQSPNGVQHQYRKWKLQSAFLDGEEWGAPGKYLVNNIPYFTFGLTTTPVPVGGCPFHVTSPETYMSFEFWDADCVDQEFGSMPTTSAAPAIAVDLERLDPADRSVKGTWHIYNRHEIAWTPFMHGSLQRGAMYAVRFPEHPVATRINKGGSKPYWMQWRHRNWRGGTTQEQVLWVEWPGATARAWCSINPMQSADGMPSAGALSLNQAKQATPVIDAAHLLAATSFSCWLDTANNLLGIKLIFPSSVMGPSASGAIQTDLVYVGVTT